MGEPQPLEIPDRFKPPRKEAPRWMQLVGNTIMVVFLVILAGLVVYAMWIVLPDGWWGAPLAIVAWPFVQLKKIPGWAWFGLIAWWYFAKRAEIAERLLREQNATLQDISVELRLQRRD